MSSTPGGAFSLRRATRIVLGVAVAARLAAFLWIYGVRGLALDVVGGGDGSAYMSMAVSVYQSGTLANSLFLPRAFLFPALAGTLYHLIGVAPAAIVLINAALNVLTCGLVVRLAYRVSGSARAALIGGVLAAVYPAMLIASVSFMTEALFLLLFVYALWFLVCFVDVLDARLLILALSVLTLATLTRAVTAALPLVWLLLLVGRARWRRYAALTLVFGALPLIVLTFRNTYYGGIPTFSTEGQWVLLFMRATSSERRATGDDANLIYARTIQEIERRLDHAVPPLTSIAPEAIWGYFQPTPAMQNVIGQLAVEKNLAYPQWYIVNSFYGLYRILLIDDPALLPAVLSVPLHAALIVLAVVGGWTAWRGGSPSARRWIGLAALSSVYVIGLNVALETAVLETRHGLAAGLIGCVLAGQGADRLIAKLWAGR